MTRHKRMWLKGSLLFAAAALPALAAAPHKVRLVELWGQLPPVVVNDGDAAVEANIKAQTRFQTAKARYDAEIEATSEALTAKAKAGAEAVASKTLTQAEIVSRKYGIDMQRMQNDEGYAEQQQARMQADPGMAMEYAMAMMEAAQPVTQMSQELATVPASIQALLPGESASRERLACRNFVASWNDPSRKPDPSKDEAVLIEQARKGFASCPALVPGMADAYPVRECRVRNLLQYLNGQLVLLQKDDAGRIARAETFQRERANCGVAVRQQQQLIEAAYADPAVNKGTIPQVVQVPAFEKDALKQLDFFAENALAASADGQLKLQQNEIAEVQAIQRQHVVHGPVVEGRKDPALLDGRINTRLLDGKATAGASADSSVSDKLSTGVDNAKSKAKDALNSLFGK